MTVQEPIAIPHPVKLTVKDFLLLDRSGAFDSYARTELIDGTVIAMTAQHRPHARAKGLLFRRLAEAVEAIMPGFEALVEASVEVSPTNAPEPDIVVTSAAQGEGLVPLAPVSLIIEIADTSAALDLGQKAQIYAANGVPEYWVVVLKERVIRQFWRASADGYLENRTNSFGDSMAAVTIDGLVLETGGI